MHLKSEDPRAADIQVVLVNGKRVATAVEFDTEEGWVDVIIPKIDPAKAELVEMDKVSDRYFDEKGVEQVPAPSLECETKRLHVTVEVIFREDPKPSSN